MNLSKQLIAQSSVVLYPRTAEGAFFYMENKDKGTEAKVAESALENFSQNTRGTLTAKMAATVLEFTLRDNLRKLDSEFDYDNVFVTCEEIPSADIDRCQYRAKVEVVREGIGSIVAPLFLDKTYLACCLPHLISKVINKFDDDFYPVLCPYVKAKEVFEKMLKGESNLDNVEFGIID